MFLQIVQATKGWSMHKVMWGISWQALQLLVADLPKYVKNEKKRASNEEEFLRFLAGK
jgi:DUF1365 family protein